MAEKLTEANAPTDFWTSMGRDPELSSARQKLSMHEFRTIARHAWAFPVHHWRDAATAPESGFFLAWSPDFPELVSCWKAELFHQARKPGTPMHLAAGHFTKWMPCPLPSKPINLADYDLGRLHQDGEA